MRWYFRPVCHLPGPKKPVCGVKCCPVLYTYRHPEKEQRTTYVTYTQEYIFKKFSGKILQKYSKYQ